MLRIFGAGFAVLGLGVFIYLLYQPIGRVDSVIEIGLGGLPRTYHPEEQLEWPERTKQLRSQIETGKDLMTVLDIKYGFDNATTPSLVRTIPKTQHRVYGQVIKLTAEGADLATTSEFLSNVINWIVKRHSDLALDRKAHLTDFLAALGEHLKLEMRRCYTEQLALNSDTPGCDPEAILRLAHLKASLSQELLHSPVTDSKIVLYPAGRLLGG